MTRVSSPRNSRLDQACYTVNPTDPGIELASQTPFEPCDLFTDDGRLVFAKVKGRSSTFSHLCTQSEVAAEMFLQHAAARDALLNKITAQSPGDAIESAAINTLAALEGRRWEAVTITLLLLGTWRKRTGSRR